MRKVLLLGGSGFLGKEVQKELQRQHISYFAPEHSEGFDLRVKGILDEIIPSLEIDAVINCAAHVGGISYGLKNKSAIFEDNSLIVAEVLRAFGKFGFLLVNPISNCAYPGSLSEYSEEKFWYGAIHDSVLAYGTTRRNLVAGSQIYASQFNLKVANLCFPNLYGPGEDKNPEKAHALGGLCNRMVRAKRESSESFEVWGSGEPIREWLFVQDAARALVLSLGINKCLPLSNFGSGVGVSIGHLAYCIKEKIDYKGDIVFDTSKPDGAKEKRMIIGSGPKQLGWKPEVDLSGGLDRTLEWYQESVAG